MPNQTLAAKRRLQSLDKGVLDGRQCLETSWWCGGACVLLGDGKARQTGATGASEERVIPSDAWQSLRESLQLSRREMEIIQLVFADEKDSNIAGSLGISRHTVDTYLRRVYAKLQVSSRPQLILRVVAAYLNRKAKGNYQS